MGATKRLEDRIVETVCGCYGYTLEELRQPNGSHIRSIARKMLAYVLYKFTPHTHQWIGLYIRRSGQFVNDGIAQTEWEINHIRTARENYEHIIDTLNLTKEDEINWQDN
nr:MAG TPA: chromosomal replication initiator protein [Bacteriophage sp.]